METTFVKIDTLITSIQANGELIKQHSQIQSGALDFWGHELGIKLLVTIIASIITWLFLKFVDKVMIPYVKKLLYNGKKIDGIWIASIELKSKEFPDVQFLEHLEIKQSSNILTGKYTVTNTEKDNPATVSIYSLTGEIISNYVTISCVIESDREIGIVNYLLQLSSGGDNLIGQALWINRSGTEIIHTKDITFTIQKK